MAARDAIGGDAALSRSARVFRPADEDMLSEWELWACANHYVTELGEDAGVMAALRCDELLDAGDFEGARTY